MSNLLDLSIILTSPPVGSQPGTIASVTLQCNTLGLMHSADLLIDPFDGVADLRARVLRAVGDPAQRFAEDGLRVLRAARFVATLEVTLDPTTQSAIEPSLFARRKPKKASPIAGKTNIQSAFRKSDKETTYCVSVGRSPPSVLKIIFKSYRGRCFVGPTTIAFSWTREEIRCSCTSRMGVSSPK